MIRNILYHNLNASMNLYLVIGGTNFEFTNGAYEDGTVITSYWVDGPLAENGNITNYFLAIRSFIANLTDWEQPPLAVPDNNPTSAYGQITLNRIGANLISTLTQIQEPCVSSTDPLTFEDLDHPYGFVLYTTTLKIGGTKISSPNLRDYGYVFLNNIYQGMMIKNTNSTLNLLTPAKSGDILRVLVENQGRICGWNGWMYPQLDIKGLSKINNTVTLDGHLLQGWYQCGINLTKASIDSLTGKFFENPQNFKNTLEKAGTSQPGVYVGQFTTTNPQDTYLDSTGWSKGQLFINGYNLGRYWPTAGPQMTLYVPKPYIQQNNTVVLIELNGAQQNYANFIDHSIFVY